jgi:twitching motility protein PilT
MLDRDTLRLFKSAPWRNPQEADEFVAGIDGVAFEDVVALVGVVSDKALVADAPRHRLRCAAFQGLAQGVDDKRLFPHYVKALRTPDRQLRTTLAALLPAVTEVARHPELCELLRSNDEELRAAGAKVLKQVGGKTVLGLLGNMVAEPEFPGRREAIDLIVPLGGHYAIPALQSVLEVGKPLEKRQALRYLGDRRYVGASLASALTAIGTAFEDPTEAVLIEAIGAYAALCSEEQYFERVERFLDDGSPSVMVAAVAGLARFASPRAILALERKLREGPTSVRLAVLETLEVIGSEEILPTLVEALAHRNLNVRTRAAEILARLSKARRLDISRTVIYLLRTGDVQLKRTAADLARSVSDPKGELWPKLVRFLRDEDWWVRERVMDSLLELAGPQLSPLIAEYLSDPSDVVRRFAVEVFARLKDGKTLGLLVRTATEDEDWWVRERAIEAVAAIGDSRTFPYLVNIMQTAPDMRVACLQALIDMKAVSTAPHVAALLGEEDSDVRLKAVQCLGSFNDPSQASAIEPLTRDPNSFVRNAALEVLSRWKIAVHQATVASAFSSLDALLVACAEHGADDLILSPGRPPFVKHLGRVAPIDEKELSAQRVEALLAPHLSLAQLEELRAQRDVDFSYEVPERGLRFRANVFQQLGGMGAVFRIIRGEIRDFDKLGLPAEVAAFADIRDGLVLVGGPTGSGKSTTLAAIIDKINRETSRHIISMEDPIEFLHVRKKGLVNQREVGTHMRTTATALRSTLRQDPDVILVGEMRDLPTISFAVAAAETGHLVFGTLHTVSADTTIDRVVNAFPPQQRDQVRSMLADSLRAVLCQYLIPRKDGAGRVLSVEVLLNNEAIANLIRKGKAYQIPSVIATSREQGMHLMDGELKRLVREEVISLEEAYMRAANKKEFEKAEEPEPAAGEPRVAGGGAQ